MKMKIFATIITSLFLMTLFSQCSSAQFDKTSPFTITKAYHQDWVGGRGGSKGTLVTLELTATISDKIVVDSIFFKSKKSKLNFSSFNKKHTITGNFVIAIVTDRTIIMHSDVRKEMANKVPEISTSFPFELTDKECVISYFIKEKKHYYKITNLTKEKPIFYP